jgi:hypothetical protein
MSLHVIEGTWEEIKRRESELIGRYLRVTIKPEKAITHKESVSAKESTATTPEVKVLRGRGMFAGRLSTDEYFQEKQKDKIREDRDL